MRKINFLSVIIICLGIILFFGVNASAETYGNLIYEASETEVTITGVNSTIYGKLSIPSEINGLPVTTIGAGAFHYSLSLSKVIIPDSVTTIESSAFALCSALTDVTFGDGVTTIGNYAFQNCTALRWPEIPAGVSIIGDGAFNNCKLFSSITIPNSVTEIGNKAFLGCSDLKSVFYNGTETEWKSISIGSDNGVINDAEKYYFYYVIIMKEDNYVLSVLENDAESVIDLGGVEKEGHTIHIYTDENCTNEFDITSPITENMTLYIRYVKNHYTYKFLDDCGALLKEETVEYGSVITAPENPEKSATQQYTYTFAGWNGYTEGMTISNNIEFTAQYDTKLNQYKYSFTDNDGTVFKEETIDYGAVIQCPDKPDDKDPYTFDYWENYDEGMAITEDITFTAVYKYKEYSITAEGIELVITVAYNSHYIIEPQSKEDYIFVGYFTEISGEERKITNEKGESLKQYDFIGDLTVYPCYEAVYMNKAEIIGTDSATPGAEVTQKVVFATDKEARFFVTTLKYPEFLNFKDVLTAEFEETSVGLEQVKNGYKYLDITSLYKYNGDAVPVNTNLIPFEVKFEIATDAPLGDAPVSLEKVVIRGSSGYNIENITGNTIEITPKIAENITIIGAAEIDKETGFSVEFLPDYTTDKSVIWSVDNEEIARISQEGVLTPVKNGNITITAKTKDGSEISASKTVKVIAYAKIDGLEFGEGICLESFSPDNREYTVYVDNDTKSIAVTPTYSNVGTLRPDGGELWISGDEKTFDLTGDETVITLTRDNVEYMTDSVYTITVVKFEGTKTKVYNQGKSFEVVPVNIPTGNTVILALYKNGKLVDKQISVCEGKGFTINTDTDYTSAKVMIWDEMTSLKPVCPVEIVR